MVIDDPRSGATDDDEGNLPSPKIEELIDGVMEECQKYVAAYRRGEISEKGALRLLGQSLSDVVWTARVRAEALP